MAHYRAGQCEPARAALVNFMTKDPDASWLGHPLMAMIEHKLGHAKEASEQLGHARDRLERHRESTNAAGIFFDEGWFDYVRAYREAGSLLEPKVR